MNLKISEIILVNSQSIILDLYYSRGGNGQFGVGQKCPVVDL